MRPDVCNFCRPWVTVRQSGESARQWSHDRRPLAPRSRASPSTHSSTVDRVVEELRRAVFEGELEAGTPLREVALADSLGVARSTVREALGVLVAEGIATREPNRGVSVASPDPDSISDVLRARLGAGDRRRPALGATPPRRPAGEVRDGARRLHRRGRRRRVVPAAQRAPPRPPPLPRRPDRLAAAGRHGRGADRGAEGRAGPDRPDPAQRPRPGRLPRRTCSSCSSAATSTRRWPTWRQHLPGPSRRSARRSRGRAADELRSLDRR